eukprot:SAG22_NODE_473_length_10069_cov_17.183250_12_plen_404_part_00
MAQRQKRAVFTCCAARAADPAGGKIGPRADRSVARTSPRRHTAGGSQGATNDVGTAGKDGAKQQQQPQQQPQQQQQQQQQQPQPQQPLAISQWCSVVGDTEAREEWWDGCGLEKEQLVGRFIQLPGKNNDRRKRRQGKVTGISSSGFGPAAHVVELQPATSSSAAATPAAAPEKKLKLLREGNGQTPFEVNDIRPAGEPWRWSFDPAAPEPAWGEVGALTGEQQTALVEFRARLASDAGASTSAVRPLPPQSEQQLLRFLRANDFIVDEAMEQWNGMVTWQNTKAPRQALIQSAQPPPVCSDGGPADMLQLQQLYPHLMCGLDRKGRPVRIDCMGRVRTEQIYSATTEEGIMDYHIWQCGQLLNFFIPAASERVGRDVFNITAIIDMQGAKLTTLLAKNSRCG